ALASASAALIWSVHPTWTNNQILRVMLNTIGAPVDGAKWNNAIGYGIVRPRIALQNPGDPGPANVYPLPDLAEAEKSASPTPIPSAKASEPAKTVAAAKKGDDGTPWLGIGLGAGAMAVAGAAAAVVVRRRRTATPPAPQQPYPAPQQGFGPPPQGFGPPPTMPGSVPPSPGQDTGSA
ncbi:peptidase S8 and S53 subtilisin kexin sedolisin, partial [Streptomyces niveiscabiei]|uniref:peptidase S8 and S53 subtilisin kexin sedolisin n=1 Tax=Streptomyces niveiscabiei TaxID=164115 RepID=UPI0029BE93AF